MKKSTKLLAFTIALALFLVLLVCILIVPRLKDANNQYYDPYDTLESYIPETKVYDDTESAPITEGMPEGVSYKTITKKTILDTKTASRLVLNFPLFSGFGDVIDAAVNSIISENIDLSIRNYGQGMYKMLGTGAKIIFEITNYEITYIDNKFISMVFSGYFVSYSEFSHIDLGESDFRYSVNIDVQEKQQIADSMILSDFLSLKTYFIQGKMNFEHGMEGLLNNANYTDLFSQYSSLYKIYPSFYFTKEKMMMIISLTSDMGGNAVFSCSINDSKAFMNVYHYSMSDLYS